QKIVPRNLVSRAPLLELRRMLELVGHFFLYRPNLLALPYGAPRRRHLRANDPVRAVGDYFERDIPFHKVGTWPQNVCARAPARPLEHICASQKRFQFLCGALARVPGVKVIRGNAGDAPTCTFAFVRFESAARCDAALEKLWRPGLGVSKLFVHALGDYDYL